MARLIDFADYLNGKKEKTHILENLTYVATREGVALNEVNVREFIQPLRMTTIAHQISDRQYDLIKELLERAPELRESISYEDLQKNANMYTASVFIAESIERLLVKDADNEIYLKYISERPGVQKKANMQHGLFDANGVADIERYRTDLGNHGGNVWRHIISLRREDAVLYEYETQDAWRDLVNKHIADHARNMGIDSDQLRWVAAFHDEGNHPHIHLMMWSVNNEGFQDKEALNKFRRALTHDIFADEIWLREQYKAEIRDDFEHVFEHSFQKLMDQAVRSSKDSLEALSKQVVQLANELPNRKTQVYGYLTPQLKGQVFEIIKNVIECPQIQPMLEKYLESHRILGSIYMKEGSEAMRQYLFRSLQKILDPQKGDRKKLQNYILKIANEMKQEERQRKMLHSYQMMSIEEKIRNDAWQLIDPQLGIALIKTGIALGKDPMEVIEDTSPYFETREAAMEAYLDVKNGPEMLQKELRLIEKHFKESIPYDSQTSEAQAIHGALKIFQHVLMAMEDGKIQADKEAHRLFMAHRLDERYMKIQKVKS